MGKKINLEASDDPCMFHFFKQFLHQTEKNEFYCDGGYVRMDSPGVKVDFRSVDLPMKCLHYLAITGKDGTQHPLHVKCMI